MLQPFGASLRHHVLLKVFVILQAQKRRPLRPVKISSQLRDACLEGNILVSSRISNPVIAFAVHWQTNDINRLDGHGSLAKMTEGCNQQKHLCADVPLSNETKECNIDEQ